MKATQAALGFLAVRPSWGADWAWGVPLIVLTVLIHVLGLGLMNRRAIRLVSEVMDRRNVTAVFVAVMGATTISATALHGIEAAIWASVYRLLGALPNFRFAMLYSLEAITSYGHENLFLESRWLLLGPIEALNGWLLFGLTTAFLFSVIEKVGWSRSWRSHE